MFAVAILGAFGVELNAQIKLIRGGKKPKIFGMGLMANSLLAVYYLICGGLAVGIALIAVSPEPSLFSPPITPLLVIKAFYIGFAISTNFAFLNKTFPSAKLRLDDIGPIRAGDDSHHRRFDSAVTSFRSYLATRF
jgi:hypothetical protein